MRQREKQSHYHLPNTSPIQLLSAQHVTDDVSVCSQSICLYLFWVQTKPLTTTAPPPTPHNQQFNQLISVTHFARSSQVTSISSPLYLRRPAINNVVTTVAM